MATKNHKLTNTIQGYTAGNHKLHYAPHEPIKNGTLLHGH